MSQLLSAGMVRGSVLQVIKKDHPDWDKHGGICFECLNQYRTQYVQQMMEKDPGELDDLDREVVKSLKDNELASENINKEYEKTLNFGDPIAN